MASSKKTPDIFTRFTTAVSTAMGHAWVFVTALIVLLVWGATGPLLGFSDTWQLIINTGTTIITFLMVFIIQNTQNRDNLAFNIKLDAIMKSSILTNKNCLRQKKRAISSLNLKRSAYRRKQRNKNIICQTLSFAL